MFCSLHSFQMELFFMSRYPAPDAIQSLSRGPTNPVADHRKSDVCAQSPDDRPQVFRALISANETASHLGEVMG